MLAPAFVKVEALFAKKTGLLLGRVHGNVSTVYSPRGVCDTIAQHNVLHIQVKLWHKSAISDCEKIGAVTAAKLAV